MNCWANSIGGLLCSSQKKDDRALGRVFSVSFMFILKHEDELLAVFNDEFADAKTRELSLLRVTTGCRDFQSAGHPLADVLGLPTKHTSRDNVSTGELRRASIA